MFTAPYTRHSIFDPANIYSLYIHYSIFSLIALNDINANTSALLTKTKTKTKTTPFCSFSASYIGRVIYHNLYPLIIANFLKKKKNWRIKTGWFVDDTSKYNKEKKKEIPFRVIKLKASSSNMMRFKWIW
jgi:hypothetical protein